MIEKWIHTKLKRDIGIHRYNHSIAVMNTSIELAKLYDCSIEKAQIAGLLHDCGKLQGDIDLLKLADDFDIILDNVTRINKRLIHSPLGAEIARVEYSIDDIHILDAIRFHTTGRENMELIEKIVYLADIIEPNRNFPYVDKIRELSYKDIDKALLLSLDKTLEFLIKENQLIHPDTIKARNYLIKKFMYNIQ